MRSLAGWLRRSPSATFGASCLERFPVRRSAGATVWEPGRARGEGRCRSSAQQPVALAGPQPAGGRYLRLPLALTACGRARDGLSFAKSKIVISACCSSTRRIPTRYGWPHSLRRIPVPIVLDESEPGFIPWFERFRGQRNEVKDGVNFGFTALAGAGISIAFNVFRFDSETGRRSVHVDSTGDRKVTLTDVLEAARMLARVLTLVASAHGELRPH